jgi:hypothetical protein
MTGSPLVQAIRDVVGHPAESFRADTKNISDATCQESTAELGMITHRTACSIG